MLLSPNSSLYHGSAERFKHIDVAKGRGFKDFGKGFYMSVDRRQAIGMMHKKFEEATGRRLNGSSDGLEKVLYRIDINEAVLGELKIKTFPSADIEWVDFILRCRQVDGTLHDYDLVIGPTADDDTRLLMKNYIDGVYGDLDDPAAKNTLLRLLKPERLGVQWFVSKQSVVDRLVRNLVVVDWKECI
mgnify:CR=1 FL=1